MVHFISVPDVPNLWTLVVQSTTRSFRRHVDIITKYSTFVGKMWEAFAM